MDVNLSDGELVCLFCFFHFALNVVSHSLVNSDETSRRSCNKDNSFQRSWMMELSKVSFSVFLVSSYIQYKADSSLLSDNSRFIKHMNNIGFLITGDLA